MFFFRNVHAKALGPKQKQTLIFTRKWRWKTYFWLYDHSSRIYQGNSAKNKFSASLFCEDQYLFLLVTKCFGMYVSKKNTKKSRYSSKKFSTTTTTTIPFTRFLNFVFIFTAFLGYFFTFFFTDFLGCFFDFCFLRTFYAFFWFFYWRFRLFWGLFLDGLFTQLRYKRV